MKARGSDNGRAKLTAEEALSIFRDAWSGQWWQREIAERFNVSQSQVSLLKHSRRWCWLHPNNEGNQMTDKTLAELESENAELIRQARLAKIAQTLERLRLAKEQAQIAATGMPESAVRDLAAAVPDNLLRDLQADARLPNPVTAATSMLPDRGRAQVEIRGGGWQPERKLEPPPGVSIMDKMLDAQDRADRADLERRLARRKE